MTQWESSDAWSLIDDLKTNGWWLRLYVGDLVQLLGPEPELPDDPLEALAETAAGVPERPDDPVLARLLPDGVIDDDRAATEFRRFTHETLLRRKRADAAALLRLLENDDAGLDEDDARQVLGCLNDLRLMLGARLMVAEGETFSGEDLSDTSGYRSFQMLAWLQDELIQLLSAAKGGGSFVEEDI